MNRIAAVIVTYHPKAELIENLTAISYSVKHTYVIDNGSDLDNKALEDAERLSNVTLVRIGRNMGIAYALNCGVKLALASEIDWVLTLDQDSLLTAGAISRMMETYATYTNKELVGILSPNHYDKNSGYQNQDYRGSKGSILVRQHVMSSGCLIPRTTFNKVPSFDDDLFIDLVDHDFCLKVKKAGLEVLVVVDAQMGHSLGNVKFHRLGPLSFFSHNYPIERHYYRARNRVVLYRRHFGAWIWRDQKFAVKDLLKVIMVETNRWKKIKAILKGTRDGLLGRMGPYLGSIEK